jgi:hypothetical protein
VNIEVYTYQSMVESDYTNDSNFYSILLKTTLSELTKQNYIDRLRHLEKEFNKPLFDIIKHAETSIRKIKDLYELDTTRKTYISVILSVFRYATGLKEQLSKAYVLWSNAFKDSDDAVEARYKKNAPSDKQKNGYVPYEEIKQKRFTLKEGTEERLLLAMYTDIYPLRADFNKVRLYKSVPSKHEHNYIHMRKTGCKLVLNEYKTASKHGKFEKELPESLCEEIHASLTIKPRDYLFVNINKEPFELSNSFTHYANRILKKIFDKPLTISLIRHSFISTLDFNKLTIEEKEQIASEMCHTTKLQDQYRLIFDK